MRPHATAAPVARIEVQKVRRGAETLYTVGLVREDGSRTMAGLYRDLNAALESARKREHEHHGPEVRIVGARFHVGVLRCDEQGNRVSIADATSSMATARLHYVPVVQAEDGTVVLRLAGSHDLPSALETARQFSIDHVLSFDDMVRP